MRKAVFLDRDGVLIKVLMANGKSDHLHSVADIVFLPGVFEALDYLRRAGWLLIVVTNQPDVARGTDERHKVEAFNAFIKKELPIDDIKVCYHDTPEGCACRKPRPGMILEAAREHDIDLRASYTVGDRLTDIQAGWLAGTRTILINETTSIGEAARMILLTEGL